MLKIILVQDFCPLKIKITQCSGGFRLKFPPSKRAKRLNLSCEIEFYLLENKTSF